MIMQSAVNLFGSEAVAAYTAANKLGKSGHPGNDCHGTDHG